MGDEVDQTILATPAAGLPQGQSVAAAPTAPQAQQQATPAEGGTGQYITVEQARAMVDDAVRRGMQSTSDRVTDKLTKQFAAQMQQIDARVAELRNAGVTVPQAEIDQAKAQVVRRALRKAMAQERSSWRRRVPSQWPVMVSSAMARSARWCRVVRSGPSGAGMGALVTGVRPGRWTMVSPIRSSMR